MKWNILSTREQLDDLVKKSHEHPQLIFKYSSRCSISDVIKHRLEKENVSTPVGFHFLDLIAYRELSNLIARIFEVHHESPQVLLIKNAECVYDASHFEIQIKEILSQAA